MDQRVSLADSSGECHMVTVLEKSSSCKTDVTIFRIRMAYDSLAFTVAAVNHLKFHPVAFSILSVFWISRFAEIFHGWSFLYLNMRQNFLVVLSDKLVVISCRPAWKIGRHFERTSRIFKPCRYLDMFLFKWQWRQTILLKCFYIFLKKVVFDEIINSSTTFIFCASFHYVALDLLKLYPHVKFHFNSIIWTWVIAFGQKSVTIDKGE